MIAGPRKNLKKLRTCLIVFMPHHTPAPVVALQVLGAEPAWRFVKSAVQVRGPLAPIQREAEPGPRSGVNRAVAIPPRLGPRLPSGPSEATSDAPILWDTVGTQRSEQSRISRDLSMGRVGFEPTARVRAAINTRCMPRCSS